MRLTPEHLRRARAAVPPKPAPRHTRQLDRTFEVLREATDHPTAEQVLTRVRSSLPKVSRGTVYRNLAKLVGEGRVQLVPVDRAARYDARLDAHDHFVCRRCGSVFDVPLRTAREWAPDILDGHVVEAMERTYHGCCRSCAVSAQAVQRTREEGR
jgi:Fur family transcriptional regulator, peroxide stress response regulator